MLKNHLYQSDSFTALKRKLYITLLPAFNIVFSLVLALLYIGQGYIDILNLITFSFLIGGLSLSWWGIVKKPALFWLIELIIFGLVTVLFLIRMMDAILLDLGVQGDDHLGTVSYWTALYYFLMFFTLRGKGALISAFTSYSMIVAAGLFHIFFSVNVNGNTIDTFIQFSAASFGMIIILYYVQRMIEGFLDMEINKVYANTDYLTKLPNRRHMEQLLENEMKKCREHETSLTVSMLDIDYFKRINDHFGHDTGDSVLIELTALIVDELRDDEYFGRWGGEEFLLIFPSKGLEAGSERAETLCTRINQQHFPIIQTLSCSFGVAEYTSNEQLKDLMKRTDLALYNAKENGRNRVECA
ncbi:MAG: GGDEF domain-containing protein [Bacillota bacterium]